MVDGQRQDFGELWCRIQRDISAGCTIRNWTKDNGYVGKDFIIRAVGADFVEVDAPFQHIPKKDFSEVYSHWNAYNEGSYPRHKLRDKTCFSKYIISILHHLTHDL